MTPVCKIEGTLPGFWGPGRCAVAVVSMSKQDFSRLNVLLRVQSGRLRVSDACVLIGLQRRQVFRLLRGLKQDGATSVLSKRRGRPSNHRLPAEVRTLVLSIVRERYADFGQSITAARSRQDPDGPARRDRRQQAAVGSAGADQGAAGLPGASAAPARCAAA